MFSFSFQQKKASGNKQQLAVNNFEVGGLQP